MFFDTHCHLNMMTSGKERNQYLDENDFAAIKGIVNYAHTAGVTHIINVGTTKIESENSIALAQRFDNVYATVGIHPCDTGGDWKIDLKDLSKFVRDHKKNKIVGIGETGLDFYHKPFDVQRQTDAFKAHIELALEYDLALVVHIRESADDALRILEEYKGQARGVIHCFAQQKYVADAVFAWGFYVGIDAPITYPKNEWFREVVAQIPLDRIILETDSPFLPPQQMRGKQNSPATIPVFAQVIADLHDV